MTPFEVEWFVLPGETYSLGRPLLLGVFVLTNCLMHSSSSRSSAPNTVDGVGVKVSIRVATACIASSNTSEKQAVASTDLSGCRDSPLKGLALFVKDLRRVAKL